MAAVGRDGVERSMAACKLAVSIFLPLLNVLSLFVVFKLFTRHFCGLYNNVQVSQYVEEY